MPVSPGETCVCGLSSGAPQGGSSLPWGSGGAGVAANGRVADGCHLGHSDFCSLSLKLVKSYILAMVKMCASPEFMLDCANSPGVPGPGRRGQGQGDEHPSPVH